MLITLCSKHGLSLTRERIFLSAFRLSPFFSPVIMEAAGNGQFHNHDIDNNGDKKCPRLYQCGLIPVDVSMLGDV